MEQLEKIKDIVKNILFEDFEANDDDFRLYIDVMEKMGIDTNISIKQLMQNHKGYNLPYFESVSRARRYVQAEYPGLKGITEQREDMQEKYKETFKK